MTEFASEDEGRIFLQALLAFSDDCDRPSLNPNCPYSEEIEGGRVCDEQCMDLLASHRRVTAVEIIQLGEGVEAIDRRPKRARRPGLQHSRAFDAAEIRTCDEHLATNQRRLTSLLTDLADLWGEPPPDSDAAREARSVSIGQLLIELPARGIDVDGLIRQEAAFMIAGTIWSAVVFSRLFDDELMGDEASLRVFDEWKALLLPNGDYGAPNDLLSSVGEAMKQIPRMSASLAAMPVDAILRWEAPKALSVVEFDAPVDENLAWLMDRFTKTYLQSWRPSSYYLEWRYLHGDCPGPCSTEFMRERHVDEAEVARTIADNATARHEVSKTGIETGRHVTKAVEMIQAGRRSSAAAVFESLAQLQPGDGTAFNNWGFCLLPDDSFRALRLLQRAAELGLDDDPTNISNRVLALGRSGRLASALSLAERFWHTSTAGRPSGAYLWIGTDPFGELELATVSDCRAYVADLAAKLAMLADDPSLAQQWRERLSELPSYD